MKMNTEHHFVKSIMFCLFIYLHHRYCKEENMPVFFFLLLFQYQEQENEE